MKLMLGAFSMGLATLVGCQSALRAGWADDELAAAAASKAGPADGGEVGGRLQEVRDTGIVLGKQLGPSLDKLTRSPFGTAAAIAALRGDLRYSTSLGSIYSTGCSAR